MANSILNHGLSALMEACKQSERAEKEDDSLFESMEEVIDDDIKAYLAGDDSVEDDIEGNGIGEDDEEQIRTLLKSIPPSDEDIEDRIDSLTESVVPCDELMYIYIS